MLAPGRHGPLAIGGLRFDPPVTLTAAPGRPAILDSLRMTGSAGWRISGLTILPAAARARDGPLVRIDNGTGIVLDRLTVASAPDTAAWSAARWVAAARNGVSLTGRDITLRNSLIRNIRHGIQTRAIGARIERNTVDAFSGDGIRALGDNSVYAGNTIRTCVKVDANHDDGIQSWSTDAGGHVGKGVVRNVTIEANLIENGHHRLACQLQGIGLFDGFFQNWTIRGNTVVVNHWHGITVMGGRHVRITGNLAVDSVPGPPGPPLDHHHRPQGRPPLEGLPDRWQHHPALGRRQPLAVPPAAARRPARRQPHRRNPRSRPRAPPLTRA